MPTVLSSAAAVRPALPPAPTLLGRDNNLNLMRLIAAALVIYTHSLVLLGMDIQQDPLARLTSRSIYLSTLAVAVFFIISGYLITATWVRRPAVGPFLQNRALRIFPGLAVCLLAIVLGQGLANTTLPAAEYLANGHTWSFFRHIVLYRLQDDLPGLWIGHASQEVNGSLWTLQYEWSCYLAVLGLGLAGLLRPAVVVGLLVAVMGANFYFELYPMTDRVRYLFLYTDMTMPYFLNFVSFYAAGMCYYFAEARGWRLRGWHAALALAVLVAEYAAKPYLLASQASELPTWVRLVNFNGIFQPVCFAVLVFYVAAVPAPGWLRHPIGKGNDLSYGVYIYGMPVQQQIIAWGGAALGLGGYIAATTALSLVLAAGSWFFVERLALRFKARSSAGPTKTALAG